MKPPLVYVVVLNWNGRADTLACLSSLERLQYPEFHTIVVDNGSQDGSQDAIRSTFPEVELIETGKNLGFAGGNNVGIRRAVARGTDYVLLLNNDTEVDPGMLDAFVRAASAHPGAGVFSGKIYLHGAPDRIWYAGTEWDPQTVHFRHLGLDQIDDGNSFCTIKETAFACGCAFFFPASRVKDVGLLDEEFFLYFEETDWCYRARAKGYASVLVPDAKLWHKVSASVGAGSPLMDYFMTRNKLLWAEKNLEPAARRQIRSFIVKSLWRRFFFAPALPSGGHLVKRVLWAGNSWLKTVRRNAADVHVIATFYGLRDFYLRRFGNCPAAVRGLSAKS
ncbi:MAG: glycosyltransferase family 2 protein [Betaproteobacteria bacterium]|nr:glycosyltransferase family 2 protein [Betaproteobacteria bacterium]